MVNFKKIFIDRAILLLSFKWVHLTDWEKKFLTDIKERIENEKDLSTHQYNKLMETYNRLR